jgi:alkanesulfonate monooxygenase SsuD/methylene tetrahydromethanopterin reductase-like flavin-dependent oxidoreductase (luciferase family)
VASSGPTRRWRNQFRIPQAAGANRRTRLVDAYFLADGLAIPASGVTDGGTAKVAGFEPVTLFSALAPLTKNIGFIATASCL